MDDQTDTPRFTPATVRRGVQAAQGVFELYVVAEIMWYTMTNGEQTLHGFIMETGARVWAELQYRAEVIDTLRKIRRLPESDQ